MACFIVPLTQAVATTLYRKHTSRPSSTIAQALPRLEAMLYGGTAMLVVDHIISGEVIPAFPFFTALTVSGGALEMLKEMVTVGLPMSLIVTAIWAVAYLLIPKKLTN